MQPTILYVEDDEQNVAVARLRLGRRYNVLIATTDVEACAYFREPGRNISAVLMDIELKGSQLDGLQLVKVLRGQTPQEELPIYARGIQPSPVPVIVVTAYVEQGLQALSQSGADHFFPKPVDFIKLSLALATISTRAAIRVLNTAIKEAE